jgi:hypothetical protein
LVSISVIGTFEDALQVLDDKHVYMKVDGWMNSLKPLTKADQFMVTGYLNRMVLSFTIFAFIERTSRLVFRSMLLKGI